MAELKKSGKYFKFLIYLIVVVLVNVAGITLFFRSDLTANKVYSISKASRAVVETLSEPLTIKVFFTKNLPAPYNNTERYLQDLLQEYSIYANRFFNYEFYNVSAEEGEITDAARENQQLANNYGIHPIQIQVVDKDEVKFQRVYMGLVMIYGDLLETIPTITATEGLEYKLTTTIQKMNNKIGALLNLPEKIDIKLYLSSSLNAVAPHMGIRDLAEVPDEIQAVVKKLNQNLYNKLQYQYVDPTGEQDLETLAAQYNVMTLSWPALGNGKVQPGKGAIGLVMQYDGKSLTVPLLQVIRLPIIGTQYRLTEMEQMEDTINRNIEQLIDINEAIGYLADHGTLNLNGAPAGRPSAQDSATNLRTLISQSYSIKDVRLKDGGIPQGLGSLVIAGPTEKFTDYELYQIDQFLMQGKNLILVLDRFNEVMPSGQQGMAFGQQPVYVPLDTGLQKLLEHYGVRIQQSYVMDENCFSQEMPQQFGGGERKIYYAPLIKNREINQDLDFMRNIRVLVAVKISPLELISERITQNKLKTYRLFASSDKSWQMRGRINLNPMFIKPPASADEMQSYPLAYLIEGDFPSYFAGKPMPVKEENAQASEEKDSGKKADSETADQKSDIDLSSIEHKGQFLSTGKPAKIFLMASADMLKNNVIDAEGKGSNAVLIQNVIDYLNGREDIAVMRGKEQRFNPLEETQAGVKTFIKTFNIVGLPVLVVLFGLGVWFRRRSRKKFIQMMFNK